MANLAVIYIAQHRYREAEALLEQSLAIIDATLGDAHRSAGLILKDYAVVLRKLKRKQEAGEVEQTAQAILGEFQQRSGLALSAKLKLAGDVGPPHPDPSPEATELRLWLRTRESWRTQSRACADWPLRGSRCTSDSPHGWGARR